jgi:hypothetical protein
MTDLTLCPGNRISHTSAQNKLNIKKNTTSLIVENFGPF